MRIIKNIFKKLFRRRKQLTPEQREVIATKDFFDRMLPGTVKFYSDHYICGNYYKSVWAITEYPPNTEETALLCNIRTGRIPDISLQGLRRAWRNSYRQRYDSRS